MKFIRFQLGIFLLTFAVAFASKYSCDADIHGSIYNASSFEPYGNANSLCIPHYAYKKLLDSDNLVPPFAQGYDDYMKLNTSEKKYLLEDHGIMTLLEHQLAFATRMHLEEWNSGIEEGSPDFLTFSPRIMRQMIMLALFHDTEYYSSASNHGEISGQYLVGILDEDLMKFLVHHTSLTHYFEFEFFKLPEAHPLEEVERTLPRRWQRWFDLADWDIDYQMTPKWPVDGEKYDFKKTLHASRILLADLQYRRVRRRSIHMGSSFHVDRANPSTFGERIEALGHHTETRNRRALFVF
jgi:hypothetical protein